MRLPLRLARRAGGNFPMTCAALLGAALTACSSVPETGHETGLEPPPQVVGLSQGRVTVVVLDELGEILPQMKVQLSWEEPTFYKTMAFTNRQGEVTFSGVPSVAEIRIDHPNGEFVRTVLVPQSGRPEMRVMLDTMGEGQLIRERERARMTGR